MKQAIDTSVKLVLAFAAILLVFSCVERAFPGSITGEVQAPEVAP
jgi:hypothetical protein